MATLPTEGEGWRDKGERRGGHLEERSEQTVLLRPLQKEDVDIPGCPLLLGNTGFTSLADKKQLRHGPQV